jgi:DNA polymerase-1
MAEGQDERNAIWNLNNGLDALLAAWNITDYQLFVTGEGNFRYQIYPEYKGNRPKERPQHLHACKSHLVHEFGALCSNGREADDEIGIAAYKHLELGDDYTIVSIDKDLNMIEGLHYSPEITRGGKVVKEARRYHVSPTDAIRFFYYQLLVGDTTDNIKGVAGVGKVKAERALSGLTTERDLYDVVQGLYGSEEEMEMNAKVLWIWRKENDDVVERWQTFLSSDQT